MSAEITSTVDW